MFMGAVGEEAAKMLIAFDIHNLEMRKLGRNRLGVTLEATFKAQLDQLYRHYEPTQRHLQFVESLPVSLYDIVIYGTYSVRPYGKPGLLLTLTTVHLHSGETQTYAAEGTSISAVQSLAQQIFHEYQRTRFPQKTVLLGKSLTLVFKGSIQRPGSSAMANLYTQAETACSTKNARLASEEELTALGTKGDYAGGVSLGQGGTFTNFWAVKYNRIYVVNWSRSTELTSLNPTEQLNYVCVR
jgi:hypothetical protein